MPNTLARPACKTCLQSTCLTVRHSCMTQLERGPARHSCITLLNVTLATSIPLYTPPRLLWNMSLQDSGAKIPFNALMQQWRPPTNHKTRTTHTTHRAAHTTRHYIARPQNASWKPGLSEKQTRSQDLCSDETPSGMAVGASCHMYSSSCKRTINFAWSTKCGNFVFVSTPHFRFPPLKLGVLKPWCVKWPGHALTPLRSLYCRLKLVFRLKMRCARARVCVCVCVVQNVCSRALQDKSPSRLRQKRHSTDHFVWLIHFSTTGSPFFKTLVVFLETRTEHMGCTRTASPLTLLSPILKRAKSENLEVWPSSICIKPFLAFFWMLQEGVI